MADNQISLRLEDSIRVARECLGVELRAQAEHILKLNQALADLQLLHGRTEQEAARQWDEIERSVSTVAAEAAAAEAAAEAAANARAESAAQAAAAQAAAAAEAAAKAATPTISPESVLEDVLNAVRNLMTSTIHDQVFEALTEESSKLGVRAAVFDVRGKAAWGASAHGFGPGVTEKVVRSLIVQLNQDNPFRQVCEHAGPVDATTETLRRNRNILDKLKPAPGAPILLIPIRSAGSVSAILYADSGEKGSALPMNALQVFAEFAGAQIDRLIALSGGGEDESVTEAEEPEEGAAVPPTAVEPAAPVEAPAPVAEAAVASPEAPAEVPPAPVETPVADAPAEEVASTRLMSLSEIHAEVPVPAEQVTEPAAAPEPPVELIAHAESAVVEAPVVEPPVESPAPLEEASVEVPQVESAVAETVPTEAAVESVPAEPEAAPVETTPVSETAPVEAVAPVEATQPVEAEPPAPEPLSAPPIEEVAHAETTPEPAAETVVPPVHVEELSAPVEPVAEAAPSPVEPPPPAAPAGFDVTHLSEADQKMHKDAKRFARLLVSEIDLYNKGKVAEGRKNHDLYRRLKSDIDRSRQTFEKRFGKTLNDHVDYFHDELLKTLAANDAAALGPEYSGSTV